MTYYGTYPQVFKNNCCVKVVEYEERREVENFLRKQGYFIDQSYANDVTNPENKANIVVTVVGTIFSVPLKIQKSNRFAGYAVTTRRDVIDSVKFSIIDCGEDIELFKKMVMEKM